ncbi:transposable element Tcb1 transposase [Trichonephila clavipes]|uniref:Transposable element Tcb1 transposase n=1 Tax=Trichonephila clavipes TaxID=2585209 RepID=A0A8X6W0S9_TRICX|nr:transposable element Tcb1 transposase [Trichonephila clavipes]
MTGMWTYPAGNIRGTWNRPESHLQASATIPRRRAPGTRYHQENTTERHRYGGAGWFVWGGIILGSRTDLHVQSVTMTGHIYRNVILEQHVRLFRGALGAEFLFMDDNARLHRANIVDECLQSNDITPRQPLPTCLPDLWRALLDEWCTIPKDQIDKLILSMPRRSVEPQVEVGGRERELRGLLDLPRVFSQNWGGTELNCTVTCKVLKATANDRRTSSPCHDEFRGSGSEVVEIRWHNKQQQQHTPLFSRKKGGQHLLSYG